MTRRQTRMGTSIEVSAITEVRSRWTFCETLQSRCAMVKAVKESTLKRLWMERLMTPAERQEFCFAPAQVSIPKEQTAK